MLPVRPPCHNSFCSYWVSHAADRARVCDNAMLRCQNGGTCHHHQRCHCSAGFTGVLCERARCSGGECDGQSSGQDPLLLLLLQPSHHSGPLGALAALALPLLSMTLC
ncbi:unnamed protein product [Boreogadus saida]